MANISLNIRFGKEAVIENREDVIPFIISIKGIKSTSPPLAFFIAIDTSLSMDGEKIFRAKEAALKIISMLRETDIVSIYGFHGKVVKVIDKLPGSKKEDLENAIVKLKLGYGTNIYSILEHMYSDARELRSSNKVAGLRIVFLTDGEPTVGPKKPEKIVSVAKKLRELGATALVIGVGTEYNERLLLDIADALNGVFEHVSKTEELSKILSEFTLATKEVSAKNVIVQIRTTPNIKVFVYGRNIRTTSEGVLVEVGNIYYRDVVDIIGDLVIPPMSQGLYDIGVVSVNYIDPETGNTEYIPPAPLKLNVLPPYEAPSIQVSEEVYAEVRAIKAARELRERLKKKNVKEITRELEDLVEATMKVGSETLYSRTLSIKSRIEKEGLTPETTKELASIISKLISGKIEKGEKSG